MKTLAFLVAMAACSAANAESWLQFEAGAAITDAVKDGDGLYFDAGLNHHTPTTTWGARGGIQMNVIDAPKPSFVPGLRLHLDYTYWGSLSWNATVAQDETNEDGQTIGYSTATRSCVNNQCGQIRTFQSWGATHSISLTAEPFWNVGHGFTVGVEAGPAIYFGPWKSDYVADENGVYGPAGSVQQVSHRIVPHLGAVVGASISRGPLSLRYEYLFAPPHLATSGSDVPAGTKGVHLLSLNCKF